MVPDIDANGKATVVPASVDQSQFATGSCAGAPAVAIGNTLNVTLQPGSAKVNLLNPSDPATPVPLVSGRYAVLATSLAKQVWRVPNELQWGLVDAGAALVTPAGTKALLQSQGVAVQIAP